MSESRIPAFPAAPEGSLERLAAISAKAYLDASEAEKQKSIVLGKVPKEIRDRIDALHQSADTITNKYYGIVKPLLKKLNDIVQKEVEIIKNTRALWEAHHTNMQELVESTHDTICTNRTALTEFAKDFVITDFSDAIPQLEKRLRLLAKELTKIDQNTAKDAHNLYVKRYNTLKAEIESCKGYQITVDEWIALERSKSAEMCKKIDEINDACGGVKPNQPPREPQPASPTASIRSDSDSDNSPSNSANRGPKDEKEDSPLFNAAYGKKDVKTFSLPQPVFGSNSDAIKKQNQQSAAAQQYQMPPAYNPASLSNGK